MIVNKIKIKTRLIFRNILNNLYSKYYEINNNVSLPKNRNLGKLSLVKSISKIQLNIGNQFCLGDFTKIISENKFSKIYIGENFRAKDHCIIRVMNGQLSIGKNVFMNSYSSINCNFEIIIEDGVLIGENVKIYDHNHKHEYIDGQQFVEPDSYNNGTVVISKNCWIGSNVTILKGVTIGQNTIIGAGCTIYKSIPSNAIIVNKQNLEVNISSK